MLSLKLIVPRQDAAVNTHITMDYFDQQPNQYDSKVTVETSEAVTLRTNVPSNAKRVGGGGMIAKPGKLGGKTISQQQSSSLTSTSNLNQPKNLQVNSSSAFGTIQPGHNISIDIETSQQLNHNMSIDADPTRDIIIPEISNRDYNRSTYMRDVKEPIEEEEHGYLEEDRDNEYGHNQNNESFFSHGQPMTNLAVQLQMSSRRNL